MDRIRQNVKTLAEVEANIRKDVEEQRSLLTNRIEKLEEDAKKKLEKAASVRMVAALLEGSGIPITAYYWDNLTSLRIDLGENLSKEDRKRVLGHLCTMRSIMGRREKQPLKELANAKRRLVTVTYSYADYPFIMVSWVERLPKNAKCKIEHKTSSYHTLTCEV